MKNEEEKELCADMYKEIQAQDTTRTTVFLESLSTKAVIAHTHPLYRDGWTFKYSLIADNE